jgi:hypothetical protein
VRILGKGQTSGLTYYDVIITRQPNSGVPVKLDFHAPETRRSNLIFTTVFR